MTDVPSGASGTPAEWVRWHVANALSWPLWQVKVLGDKADRAQARILWWGERATPERAEHLAWWRRTSRSGDSDAPAGAA